MEQWSNRDLESNIDTLLIFYLEIINRCKEEFIKKLTYVKNDFNNYIDNEINSFENLAKSFVATRTVEDYSVFESYGIEHKNFTKEENETKLERNGTIDDIRKNKLPEKRMLIWGNAGLGKSTTFQYLTYIDAKSYKAKQSDVIPVYVPLGMLIDIEETIEDLSITDSKVRTQLYGQDDHVRLYGLDYPQRFYDMAFNGCDIQFIRPMDLFDEKQISSMGIQKEYGVFICTVKK